MAKDKMMTIRTEEEVHKQIKIKSKVKYQLKGELHGI